MKSTRSARLALVLLMTLTLVAHLRMLPGVGGVEAASLDSDPLVVHALGASAVGSSIDGAGAAAGGGDAPVDVGHRHGALDMLVTCIAALAALALGLCLRPSRLAMIAVVAAIVATCRGALRRDAAPGRDPPGLTSLRTVVLVR